MPALDFFGAQSRPSPTSASSGPGRNAAVSSSSSTRVGVKAAHPANGSSSARSTAGAKAVPTATSATVVRPPLRGVTPSSSSASPAPLDAPAGENGGKTLNGRPGGSLSKVVAAPKASTSHRPPVVVVKTVAAKPRPPSQGLNASAGANGPTGAQVRYNALPEERRLRIAQERDQRLREEAEKQRAQAAEAAAALAASTSASRPLKKRRTGGSVAEGKRKSPSSADGTPPKRRSRSRIVASDEESDDEDSELFGKDTSSSRTGRDNSRSRDDWVIPPRQPRDVVREDEVAELKDAVHGADASSSIVDSSQNSSMDWAGIQSKLRTFRAISSVSVVNEAGIKLYAPYFKDIDDMTTITLEYPAMHASETFPLLVPKPLDEYDPISELLRTVHVMVSSYFPEEQVRTRLFGRLEELDFSGSRLLPRDSSSPLPVISTLSGQVTPNSMAPASATVLPVTVNGSAALSPLTATASGASTPMRLSQSTQGLVPDGTTAPAFLVPKDGPQRLSTPQPNGHLLDMSTPLSTPAAGGVASSSASADGESILRSFQRARNRRNGPLFLRTVARFNETIRQAKRDGLVLDGIRKMSESGIPERLWATIHDQCYSRVVGPKVEELNHYQAFSDNVYGELLPRFSSEIAQLTGLGPSSVFVDMGSGVGNVLVQLALQTGCSAYGCEMMETPATLARAQIEEARARWAMWGLRGGEVEAWKDNFCTNDKVGEVLRRADVVLVNNYAFTPATNDKLVLQFLDLKDGCHVISLKPFVPPDFRLTERTLSSPLAILRVVERTYTSGCVSWANGGGRYYIHTVDRSLVRDFKAPSKMLRGDTRKRRWKRNVEEEDDEMMSM